MSRKANTIYVIGSVAFVPHPAVLGLWLRTDSSVAKVACSACGAKTGSLCVGLAHTRGAGEPRHETHWQRRSAARRVRLADDRGVRTVVIAQKPTDGDFVRAWRRKASVR